MNALVRKEVRSVLSSWLLAMTLAILPVWLVWPGPNEMMVGDLGLLVFAPFGLGVLVLSLAPFGQELNWGTFPVLLSQPIPRQRIWSVKVIILAVALACVFVALCISSHLRVDSVLNSMKHTVWRNAFNRPYDQTLFLRFIAETQQSAWQETFLVGATAVLSGFAGGLWTTLLFRQVTAAFWVTLLVPLAISLVAAGIFWNVPEILVHSGLPTLVAQSGLLLIFGAYCAASFFWAKSFFLRVQDTQWTGGVVALPNWGELGLERGSGSAMRGFKPMRMLLRKEFQAQQINLLLAGGLLLAQLGSLAVRRWSRGYLGDHRSVAMALEMFPLLWLVMPLLVGSVAIAEERKLGTLQSSLCLPFSRRLKFAIMWGVAMVLGVVLGGILPLAVEYIAGAPSMSGLATGLYFLGEDRSTLFLQLWGSVSLTLLAFYGSTLTRNALQAMGAALLAGALVFLVILGATHAEFGELILWRGRLIAWIGWPVMTCILMLSTYRNHGRLQPGARAWIHNGLGLMAGLLAVSVVTTTVYHRAWEAWLPKEPLHRFNVSIVSPGSEVALPANPFLNESATRGYIGVTLQDLTPALAKEFRLNQTNGALIAQVAAGGPAEMAGLKPGDLVTMFNDKVPGDGRQLKLLAAETPVGSTVPVDIIRNGSLLNVEITMGRVPSSRQMPREARAAKIEAMGFQKAVIMPDGRLWLQHRQERLVGRRSLGQMVDWYAMGPAYTGFVGGSNWKDVAIASSGCLALQGDGTLWDIATGNNGAPTQKRVGAGDDWVMISGGWEHFCALKADGTLWEWGQRRPLSSDTSAPPSMSEPVRVGTATDWVAVCCSLTESAAIKSDGSVWRWHWNSETHWPPQRWLSSSCTQPVSLTLSPEAIACVCADGSLWIGGVATNSAYVRLIGVPLAIHSGEMVRWGNDSDWRRIRFVGWGKVAGLKADGSLWEWNFRHFYGPLYGRAVQPSMPSHYMDWLAVCGADNDLLTLARDGSLCAWGDAEDVAYSDWQGLPDLRRLLAVSAIKARKVADLAK